MRIFEVELSVSGSITTPKRAINFNTDKELNLGRIFRSDISIQKQLQGFKISTTVYTINQDRASKVALLFIGRMLDVLSMRTNLSLNISSIDYRHIPTSSSPKALNDEDEFRFCFEHARILNLQEDRLLRAFSWYRKGLYTEDPFDKFLAFWNSICVIADAYCEDTPRTRMGIINKIWSCFTTLWGPSSNWQYINGNERWINNNNEIRNMIAHGGVAVDIDYVENIINELDAVQNVAYKFLLQWADRLNRSVNNQNRFEELGG